MHKLRSAGRRLATAVTASAVAAGMFGVTAPSAGADGLPGQLSVDHVELTQGIQNAANEVPLIGNKRTYVRVYLRHQPDGLGSMPGVTGTLTTAGVTIGALRSVTSRVTGSNPATLDDSLLFDLPAVATTPGSRDAKIVLTPPAGRGYAAARIVRLDFGPETSMRLIGLRYSYYNVPEEMRSQLAPTQAGLAVGGGWWQARPLSAWEPLRRRAENALPLSRLVIDDQAPANADYSEWGSAWFDCRAVNDRVRGWGCAGYENAKNWAASYADRICPAGGCTIILLQPEINTAENGTSWDSAGHNHITNMQGEAQPDRQGNTLAHEIAHSLGVGHTLGTLSHYESTYPRTDGGLGPYVAIRNTPALALMPGQNAWGQTTTWDLMTYTRPAWFSPFSYCKALAGIPGKHSNCPLKFSS